MRSNYFVRSTLPDRQIPSFEQREFCDCVYCPNEPTCGETCRNRLERYECTNRNCHHPMCSNRRIQHGDFPTVKTGFHPVKGRILRLGETGVRKGTMIGEYIGEVIGDSERKRREMLHGFSALAYTMNYSSDTCIDA